MRLLVARSRRSPSRAAFRIALPALLTLVRGACFVDDLGCCAFDETAAKADDAAKPFCTALCTTDITDTDAPCYVPSAHCEAGACACDAPLENETKRNDHETTENRRNKKLRLHSSLHCNVTSLRKSLPLRDHKANPTFGST